ncbi:uncharacterized protein METZ01_LOCUS166671 [marine metagenome]|uniref:Uncharacterized protein n=1 Tax=marine metagenome TaxID=408172 RepID=A0A382BKT9_9ZZZZ
MQRPVLAHAACEVFDAIRGAPSSPLPVSVMLTGEYGILDLALGEFYLLDQSILQAIIGQIAVSDH